MQSVETYLNYKIGLRMWCIEINHSDVWLVSCLNGSDNKKIRWNSKKPFEASCNNDRVHSGEVIIPSFMCSCGIYAYKLNTDPKKQTFSFDGIIGKVALWGKIIEHEIGFRAQFASPISIEYFSCSHCHSILKIDQLKMLAYYSPALPICDLCSNLFPTYTLRSSFPASFLLSKIKENYGIEIKI